MRSRTPEFDAQFLQDLRNILLSTSEAESYDPSGNLISTENARFLDGWQLCSLNFDPNLGRERAIAKLSANEKVVTAVIDAKDFVKDKGHKSRNSKWNTTDYQDLAVLVSVLIEEQIITWNPSELKADRVRICSPVDR
jgi:hypothetical protein